MQAGRLELWVRPLKGEFHMREIGVGLLGLGNVGIGVAKGLAANGELIAGRTGFRLAIRLS